MERKVKLPPEMEKLVKRAEADAARQRKEHGFKVRGSIKFNERKKLGQ